MSAPLVPVRTGMRGVETVFRVMFQPWYAGLYARIAAATFA